MFESICLRHQSNSDTTNPIDLGFLAEAMLFYGDVLIIARENMLAQLVRGCGPETLPEVLDSGSIRLQYEYHLTGIFTHNADSPQERHSGIIFNLPSHALQYVAPKIFTEIIGRSGRGRRLANRFTKFVCTVEQDSAVLSDFGSDLLDKKFISSAVTKLLELYAPEYLHPRPLVFDIFRDGEEFAVESNINFEEANRSYHLHIPPSHSSLSPGRLGRLGSGLAIIQLIL